MSKPKQKFYRLRNKRGMGGFTSVKPARRKQDAEFEPGTFYACVFFPKIEGIGNARLWHHSLAETLSCSRSAAIARFMDGKAKKDTWDQYRRAGWKVRKIKVSDAGQA